MKLERRKRIVKSVRMERKRFHISFLKRKRKREKRKANVSETIAPRPSDRKRIPKKKRERVEKTILFLPVLEKEVITARGIAKIRILAILLCPKTG